MQFSKSCVESLYMRSKHVHQTKHVTGDMQQLRHNVVVNML